MSDGRAKVSKDLGPFDGGTPSGSLNAETAAPPKVDAEQAAALNEFAPMKSGGVSSSIRSHGKTTLPDPEPNPTNRIRK